MIEFNQGEVLTASKMNSLARQSQGTSQQGMLHRSPTGIVSGTKDTRNYIDQYRPFDVYRHTATKLRVRAGAWEHYFCITRTVTNMAIDSGTSANPEDYKTISPTLSASTAYTVYLEFYSTGLTLEAKCVATSSFPADATDYYRYILARFETTSDGSIPSIQPEVGHIIFQGGGSSVTRPYDYTQLTDTTFKIDAQYYEKTINVGGVWTDLDPIFWYTSGFTASVGYDFESNAISAATWVYLSIDISSVNVEITITAATTCPDGTDTVEVVPLYKVLWDGSKISGVVDYRHNMRLPLMR